jgi:addiction module HigA family antidote
LNRHCERSEAIHRAASAEWIASSLSLLAMTVKSVTETEGHHALAEVRRPNMAPVVHPGRLLKRELAARKLSANRLALDLGVPSGRITDILNGRRAITADTAVRLGRYFGNSAQFWLDLQAQYDIGVVERDKGAEITRRVRPADAA